MESVVMKLPYTFESSITSNNRLTIPTMLTYIEPGDRIEGYIQLLNDDKTYPFDKKLSSSRHITIGHIKSFLPGKQLPSRIRVTVQKIHKSISEALEFNLVSYRDISGNYTMNYSTIKPVVSEQLLLDNFTQDFFVAFFANTEAEINQFLEPFYVEETKKWVSPVNLLIDDEFGAPIPVLLFLVLSQDYYQKFNDRISKIELLIQRLSNWIYELDDFNMETLSKLSSQLQDIIEHNKEPDYLDMKAILSLPDLRREIALIVLKEHRNGGINLDTLLTQVKATKQKVSVEIDELVKDGILRLFEDGDSTIIDTLWKI